MLVTALLVMINSSYDMLIVSIKLIRSVEWTAICSISINYRQHYHYPTASSSFRVWWREKKQKCILFHVTNISEANLREFLALKPTVFIIFYSHIRWQGNCHELKQTYVIILHEDDVRTYGVCITGSVI